MERGIVITASAGNDGSGIATLTNLITWVTTVASSIIDR